MLLVICNNTQHNNLLLTVHCSMPQILKEYPVNATCGDLDGNHTAGFFEACGAGRMYDSRKVNESVAGMIESEAAPVCCKVRIAVVHYMLCLLVQNQN